MTTFQFISLLEDIAKRVFCLQQYFYPTLEVVDLFYSVLLRVHNNREMSVVIIQPNLFPYIGYFEFMNEANVFVFDANANFNKTGFNRN